MDAEIRIRGLEQAAELSHYARQRLGPIVRHPRSGVEGVSLSVNKVPGGGPEGIRCQILVRVSPRLSLSVERSEASAHAAIDAAADGLGWALSLCHGGRSYGAPSVWT